MSNNFDLFKKRFGTQTSNNFQLLRWAKDLGFSRKNFFVIMRDEIDTLPKDRNIFVICNIHKHNEQGVHWSCFNRNIDGISYFFDSYGLKPTKQVENFIKPYIGYNNRIQENNSSYCGQISLFILFRLFKGDSFKDIILTKLNNSQKFFIEND